MDVQDILNSKKAAYDEMVEREIRMLDKSLEELQHSVEDLRDKIDLDEPFTLIRIKERLFDKVKGVVEQERYVAEMISKKKLIKRIEQEVDYKEDRKEKSD